MNDLNKTITVTNTGMIITPYNKGQCNKIERDTSIFNEVYHCYDPVIGFIVNGDVENKEKSFVTTKNSDDYIKALFPDYTINHLRAIKSKNIKHDFVLNDDINLTDVQTDVVSDIMKHQFRKEWFVNLQTALGKTLLSVYLISIFRCKSLIMCYSKDILYQWIKTIREKTDLNPSCILLIDSSKLLYNICIGNFNTGIYNIFMVTPKLVTSFCEKYGYFQLFKVFENMGIGLKIFDEAHRNISNMVKINGFSNTEKTLYLSADFSQANKDKEKLYYKMMYGVPIFKPTDEVMNVLKYTQAIVMEYDSEPSVIDITSIYTRYGFSSTKYMRYQFEKKLVFDVLDNTLTNIFSTNNHNFKTLILVSLTELVDILVDKLKEKFGDSKIIGRFHSKVDQEEKDITKQSADIIVSTYQSFGTGVDVADIKYVISIDQCNKIWDNQAAGRARPLSDGSDAFYIMLVDKGFKYSSKKLKLRLNYLQATKIKKITRIKYYPILPRL